mmetsp:Transcript_26710/g.61460  ORF Transcript_26710/g.61460 Transcript_26710/m.61460 type:complete len:201 (-) Transcript_26710:338-940(-)
MSNKRLSCRQDANVWETFDGLLARLNALELWRELAVRPSVKDCCPEDQDLLRNDHDDMQILTKRCGAVRDLLNENLIFHDLITDRDLIPKKSSIEGAGTGLFFLPEESEIGTKRNCISKGDLVCYYYGHMHNYRSAKFLSDDRYLMHVRDDIFVDPGPLPHAKGRYINDPMDREKLNCIYKPDVQHFRCNIIATKKYISW